MSLRAGPHLGSIIQPFGSHSAAALFVITETAGPTRQPFGRTSVYGTRVNRDLVKSRVLRLGDGGGGLPTHMVRAIVQLHVSESVHYG